MHFGFALVINFFNLIIDFMTISTYRSYAIVPVFDSCFSQSCMKNVWSPHFWLLTLGMEIREASLLISSVGTIFQSLIILAFEGCPVLPLSLIQHFLRVCEHWLSTGNNQNIILLHCERGGWPLLAFLLSCLLIYKKFHGAEHKTLDIIYREAPKGFLQLFSALNPMPSQLRYMQYVARRNISPEWPPMERALSLDCLILQAIPSFDSDNGCRPLIRIFGRNLLGRNASMTNMIFSMPKKKSLRYYRQVGVQEFQHGQFSYFVSFCFELTSVGNFTCRRIVT
jgi:hypothetical protein